MKVHILQIPPDGQHLEGEDPGEILDLTAEEFRPVSPVSYTLDIGLSGGGLFATGRLGVTMQMQCVRCLQLFCSDIAVDDFACQVELTGAEMVDLTEPVREDILLALPAHPHCDWYGERVCPGAFQAPVETPLAVPEAEARVVWGALDQLKLKD